MKMKTAAKKTKKTAAKKTNGKAKKPVVAKNGKAAPPAKKKAVGIGATVKEMLTKNFDVPYMDVEKAITKRFPHSNFNKKCFAWYKSAMKKEMAR